MIHDGAFTLYEDDNEGCGYMDGVCVKTVMTYREEWEGAFEFLNQAEIEFDVKDEFYDLVMREKRVPVVLAQLEAMGIERGLCQALAEILTGI